MELFDLVLDYLTDQEDAVKRLITLFLNQVMEVELEQQVGASNYERTDNRVAHRNGKRPRTLKTRYGDLELLKPEIREKPFETVIFDKYSRVERALEAAIVESYIQGVSTRRISSIIEALGLKGISPDTVSSMSKDLDNEVQAFLNRPIECLIPYLIVDAVYIKCRDGGRVVSKAVLIIAGVREDGYRELFSVKVADREDEGFWRALFEELKDRGISGVKLVVSDGHKGIQKAVRESFLGSSWQMCLIHYLRAIMRYIPVKAKDDFLVSLKAAIFENEGDILDIAEELHYCGYCKAADTIERFLPDIHNYQAFPQKHWKKIRTTNLVERVNKEIKRRTRVVGAFPSDDSLIRLVGSILMNINEEWVTGRRYLSMDLSSVDASLIEPTMGRTSHKVPAR